MVVFQCACGETLKKPQVGRHLQGSRCSYVSCVDCQETFPGVSFESHVKCVSEAQKYMGALYNEPGKREGAKQDKWLESVQSALAAYSGPLASLVARLKQLDNIPRKERAFLAFAGNSLALRSEDKARQLWQIIAPKEESSNVSISQVSVATTWQGWESEAASVLRSRGGRMHWKILRDELAKKHNLLIPSPPLSFEERQWLSLANLPAEWAEGSYLKLPAGL